MADVWDSLEADYGGSGSQVSATVPQGGDVWDSLESDYGAPKTEPSFLQNVGGDIAAIPSGLGKLFSAIPEGVSNLGHLSGDLLRSGIDATKMGYDALTGDTFIPSGLSADDEEIVRKKLKGELLNLGEDQRLDIIKSQLLPQAAKGSAEQSDRAIRTLKGVENISLGTAGAIATGGGILLPAVGAGGGLLMADQLNQSLDIDPETTAKEALAGLRRNIVQGTVLGNTTNALGSAASVASDIIQPLTKAEQQVESLGIPSLGELKKLNKNKPTINGETPLDQAITGATDRGVFGVGETTPEAIKIRNDAAQSAVEEELHGNNGILAQADAAQKNVEIPVFTKARAFIAANRQQAKNLSAQLAERVDNMLNGFKAADGTIYDGWDGTVSGLSKEKTIIGKDGGFKGDTVSKGLDKAIYQDLKTAVEKQAEDAVSGLGKQVKDLNSDLSEHYTLQPLIDKAILKAEQAGFKPGKSGIIASALKGAGKGLGLGLSADAVGFHVPSTNVAAGLAAYEGAKAVLRKPLVQAAGKAIQNTAGGALDLTSSALKTAAKAAPAVELSNSLFRSSQKSLLGNQRSSLFNPPKGESMDNKPAQVNEEFLNKEEGGQKLSAYRPDVKGSGVTVSTGVDLGQRNKSDLEALNLSKPLMDKLSPYLGKKDSEAASYLKANPLKLSKDEANELDYAVKNDLFNTVSDKLESSSGTKLDDLPPEAQAVVKSLTYNFGANLDTKLPSVWKAITDQDWGKLQDLLVNTKWKQPELEARRNREAALLDPLVA